MSKIPTIAMIPSAYKSGKVYSVLPTDGSADLSFARASEATRVNENGFIETVGSNVPRIDYTDGGCPKLLLEPQSTNLITYSEDFSDASWNKAQATLTPNTVLSPEGTLTASTLTATGNFCELVNNYTGSIGVTYTVSFWLKRKTGNGGIAIKSVENINTVVSVTDEWQRFSVTATSTTTLIRSAVRVLTSGDEVYVWGAQLEQISYGTSYIPTSGATATRVAETSSKANISNFINSSEGVLYAEISALSNLADLGSRAVAISDGTGNNRLYIFLDNNANRISYQFVANGILQSSGNNNISDVSDFFKVAISYKTDQLLIYVNGTEFLSEVTSLTVPNSNTFNRIGLDSGSGFSNFYGKIKDLRVYNQALTDTELQNLTS